MSLLERLKWWVAPKEMEELHRWRSQWEEHRRWLAEFEHTSATLDHMRSWVDGTPLIEMKSISRFREELRSKMNAQIDFLKRCKELGLQGGNLSNWLDEIEALRAENEALKQQVEQIEQETAEACAKLLENGNFLSKESLVALAANGAAKAIRSGAWKEFIK